MQTDTGLHLAVCWRPIPARVGEEHAVTRILRARGHRVMQTADAAVSLDGVDVVLMLENCRWFPAIMRQLAAHRRRHDGPLVFVWHWEPLPLPKAAGVPPPALSLRERAKILLRDVRATDAYTNLSSLRSLRERGWPDLLVVSSQAWREALAEDGVTAEWVPYGYESGDGSDVAGARDITALFLGALDVPRRRRIIAHLRRSGVDLVAKGDWFDRDLWGDARTRLINRAAAFLNIQRYPGEISAHRLILGRANKALVVSEPIYRPAPFVPGEHYVEAAVHEMAAILEYYRAHGSERDDMVARASFRDRGADDGVVGGAHPRADRRPPRGSDGVTAR